MLGALEADGYEIESVAHMGDTLEDMAHDPGQVERLTRAFEKVRDRGRKPRAERIPDAGAEGARVRRG